jgi:ATP-dependent RNA helicase RhlE
MPLRKLLSLFKRKKAAPAHPHHKQSEPHAPVAKDKHPVHKQQEPGHPKPAAKPSHHRPAHGSGFHQARPAQAQHPRPQHQPVRPAEHAPRHPEPRPAPKAAPQLPTVKFEALGLAPKLLKALHEEGYSHPTPIQQQAIPVALSGRDILGCAQTGTGKTAAFALPILQRLDRPEVTAQQYHDIRALIVTPTRELAAQIEQSFKAYGRHAHLRQAVVYGGVFQGTQIQAMRGGVDILVATPGRLLDLMNQRMILLHKVEILVLDEADRMLDMGFINDIKRIVAKVPVRRQTLFFSATMPEEIRKLAGGILDNPVSISVTPQSTAAETVEQSVYFVERDDKAELLRHLLKDKGISRALVFTRTKVRADRVARKLSGWGIPAQAIHGDKSQGTRERVLASFKSGGTRVLVASDVVSRGIDIEDISHVINFDIPHEAEAYVHRIGRTGRAGASGTAVSFCDSEEREDLRQVEKLLGRKIPVVEHHPYLSKLPVHQAVAEHRRRTGRSGRPHRR